MLLLKRCYLQFGGRKIKGRPNQKRGKYYRINQNIQATSLRVIDSDGNNLGEISKSEALSKAIEAGLDLIEIAPLARPPVAKILDFKKFLYEENKKEQAAKKNAKEVELKEIWLSPRIAEHDLNVRIRRAEEFLGDGDKIMFRVKFRGREMAHTELGFQLLNRMFETMGDKILVERDPKLEGRSITVIIGKGKGEKKVDSVQVTGDSLKI